MSGQEDIRLRRRAIVAAVLGLAAMALFVLDSVLPTRSAEVALPVRTGGKAPDTVIDTLMARYGIERTSIKTWRVLSPDKKPIRVEQRISVPREFPTLVFNYELQQLLGSSGVTVVGTERSRDFVVTMHLVQDGQTVRSMAFYLVPDDPLPTTRVKAKRRSS